MMISCCCWYMPPQFDISCYMPCWCWYYYFFAIMLPLLFALLLLFRFHFALLIDYLRWCHFRRLLFILVWCAADIFFLRLLLSPRHFSDSRLLRFLRFLISPAFFSPWLSFSPFATNTPSLFAFLYCYLLVFAIIADVQQPTNASTIIAMPLFLPYFRYTLIMSFMFHLFLFSFIISIYFLFW